MSVDPLEWLCEPRAAHARERRVFGVVTAKVERIEAKGVYRLKYLSMGGRTVSARTRVMMPMAGNQRGTYFFPEKGDEVIVAFEEGNTKKPVILGAVWNKDSPTPAQAKQAPENNIRTIVSRSGHELTFDDTPGTEKVTLRTHSGHELVLDDRPGQGKVTLQTKQGRQLVLDDTPLGSAVLQTTGVQIKLNDAGGGALQIEAIREIALRSNMISIQANIITVTTTGVAPASGLTIDGVPYGQHKHVQPPPYPPPPAPMTGGLAPA